MITIIVLTFVGMAFALAGTFISIEAKRRSDRERSVSAHTGRASMERAASDSDNDQRDLAA
jgi:hypothetical protein